MEYNKRICDMAVGDQVEGFYVLKTAQGRTSNNGRPFLAAVVSDRTGSIDAKAWDYAGSHLRRRRGPGAEDPGDGDGVPGGFAAEHGAAAADGAQGQRG